MFRVPVPAQMGKKKWKIVRMAAHLIARSRRHDTDTGPKHTDELVEKMPTDPSLVTFSAVIHKFPFRGTDWRPVFVCVTEETFYIAKSKNDRNAIDHIPLHEVSMIHVPDGPQDQAQSSDHGRRKSVFFNVFSKSKTLRSILHQHSSVNTEPTSTVIHDDDSDDDADLHDAEDEGGRLSLQQAGHGRHDVVRKGIIKKRGQFNQAFRRRFFVLDDRGNVAYYSNEKDFEAGRKPKGSFSCAQLHVVQHADESKDGALFTLLVHESCALSRDHEKVIECACLNEQERGDWVSALESFGQDGAEGWATDLRIQAAWYGTPIRDQRWLIGEKIGVDVTATIASKVLGKQLSLNKDGRFGYWNELFKKQPGFVDPCPFQQKVLAIRFSYGEKLEEVTIQENEALFISNHPVLSDFHQEKDEEQLKEFELRTVTNGHNSGRKYRFHVEKEEEFTACLFALREGVKKATTRHAQQQQLSPWQKTQRLALAIHDTDLFQQFFGFIILASFVVSLVRAEITPAVDSKTDKIFETLDLIFTLFFTAELVVTFIAHAFMLFFRDAWRVFDFVIVSVSLLALSGAEVPAVNSVRAVRVLRAVRLLKKSKRCVCVCARACARVHAYVTCIFEHTVCARLSRLSLRRLCLS